MDVITGFNVARKAFELLKVIKDGRDESLTREAAGELSEKITELQMLNAELFAYIRQRDRSLWNFASKREKSRFLQCRAAITNFIQPMAVLRYTG